MYVVKFARLGFSPFSLFLLPSLAACISFSSCYFLVIFRSFSHPRRRNPLLFYIARPVFVSFYFSVLSPLCPSLSFSLSFYLSLCSLLYALSSVPFVYCSHGWSLNPIRRECQRKKRREEKKGSDESGQTARKQNDSVGKKWNNEGVKVDTIERETLPRGYAPDLFSQPPLCCLHPFFLLSPHVFIRGNATLPLSFWP